MQTPRRIADRDFAQTHRRRLRQRHAHGRAVGEPEFDPTAERPADRAVAQVQEPVGRDEQFATGGKHELHAGGATDDAHAAGRADVVRGREVRAAVDSRDATVAEAQIRERWRVEAACHDDFRRRRQRRLSPRRGRGRPRGRSTGRQRGPGRLRCGERGEREHGGDWGGTAHAMGSSAFRGRSLT